MQTIQKTYQEISPNVFKIRNNPFLFKVQPTSGTWPRHFTISKSGKLMFVALQKRNLIDMFKINQSNGQLEKCCAFDSLNSPAYVGIL